MARRQFVLQMENVLGAILDRNGLRPSRYWVTSDDICVMGSEAGVLPMDTKKVIKKGRLEPGKIFLIDTVEGRIINDDELKQRYIDRQPYEEWIKTNVVDLRALPEPKKVNGLCKKTLLERQRAFGYTVEDIKVILRPMSMMGIEATGAMGDDTPLAILSQKPKLLYEYFKQLFAQVTNPPVDPIREEIIMAEDVMLGAEGNLLDETLGHCRRLRLKRPILTNKELEKIVAINENNLKSIKLNMLFERSKGGGCLEEGLEKLFKEADQAISDGVSILILTDRGVSKNKVPMPSLLACASLHHHLIRQGTRVRVSIVLETGEAREIHHFATLIGYGANAINPYLTFETIEDEINQGNYYGFKYSQAEHNYIKSTRKGLFKVLSKMGISTIQSYCGAQVFEAIGLGENFIDKYFLGTSSRIGGIGIEQIAEESLWRHSEGYFTENRYDSMLDIGGRYAWRKEGEHHQLNPETIAFLQHACRTNDYECYKKYSKLINTRQTNLANIRGLLKFKKRTPIPIEEVESATEIVKRFATGAMSFGSISKEAHETLAIAMNRLGGFSNTGEGGEKPERFLPLPNGDSRRSRIKQVAQGRFGVTIEYLANADQIQIKMAQGAKPGEGGQLPGHKVSQEIADTRLTTKGVGLISPPPHHDIYSIEDLSQLIHDLKNANPDADVSVKLVSEIGVGTIAAGVSKGKSDHLLISGYEGGTGASPQTSIKNAGLPMELGIAETQQVLVMNDLRGRIRVQTDGQLKTGRDVVIAGMLGADEFGFATTALITMGCVLLRKCHLNTCSVGIATQDKSLRKKFAGKPEYVVNFFMFIAEEIREIMASLGIKEFNDLVGRVEYLETNDLIGHWKARGIDLINILHKVDVPDHVAIRHVGRQNHDLEMALDNTLIEKAKEAIEKQKPVSFKSKIVNVNRTVGTMMSGIVAKRYGLKGLPEDCIKIKFDGSAGQSFGAFLAHGITLELEGDSNDYVGKGLSGGKIIIYPPKNAPAAFIAEDNIIIGNVVLYGGISGEAYFRGIGGERFCVRNSGVHVVIEGIGDHGCEYMTGGRVVVLGRIGRNFAAGMSGGIAYIWDKDGDFERRCNMDLVELFPVDVEEDVCELKTMIEKHFAYTGSTRAKEILDEWTKTIVQFVKVYPTDYRRVVEEASRSIKESTIPDEEYINEN